MTETLANALSTAAATVSNTGPDPLMRPAMIPAALAELAYQSMFMSMAYYLKYKVKAAKESELKKYGVYIKSADNIIFGAYITVIDNGGEDSLVLDYTYDAEVIQELIDAGVADSIDEPIFHQYVSSATAKIGHPNGSAGGFDILPDYIHTIYVLAADLLRQHIESLLDDPNGDHTVTVDNLFTATGFLDDNGAKRISIEKDELVKQIIKSDDLNEVA